MKADCRPSQVTQDYWIHAKRKKGPHHRATDRSGKWLVFVDAKDVDEVWDKIKRVTEEGKLGGSAKVATAKSNPFATSLDKRVICVYTYDWTDEKDVKRIREELESWA